MKALNMSSALLVLIAVAAQANPGKALKLPACENIVKSCESAGFEPGNHKKNGKGLWVDCVGAIAKGKQVSGVTVAQADAQSCVDARKSLKTTK